MGCDAAFLLTLRLESPGKYGATPYFSVMGSYRYLSGIEVGLQKYWTLQKAPRINPLHELHSRSFCHDFSDD